MTSQNLYDVSESTSVLKASFPICKYEWLHPVTSGTYLMLRRNRYPSWVWRRTVHFGTTKLSNPCRVSDWSGFRLVVLPQKSSHLSFTLADSKSVKYRCNVHKLAVIDVCVLHKVYLNCCMFYITVCVRGSR